MSENVNCLSGKRCPKCGQADRFFITATSVFELVDDGTSYHGDVEYDESNRASCPKCDFSGTWGEFDIPKPAARERRTRHVRIRIWGPRLRDFPEWTADRLDRQVDTDEPCKVVDVPWPELRAVIERHVDKVWQLTDNFRVPLSRAASADLSDAVRARLSPTLAGEHGKRAAVLQWHQVKELIRAHGVDSLDVDRRYM